MITIALSVGPLSTGRVKRNVGKTLAAVLVVIAVGIGTFYGTTLLASTQHGGSPGTTVVNSTSQVKSGGQSTSSSSKTVSSATVTSSITGPFQIVGSPFVTPHGNNASLSAQYVNKGTSTIQANVYIAVRFSNGTLFTDGMLFYPAGPKVAPNGNLTAQVTLGPFSSGNYTVIFYVTNDIFGNQLSESTTLSFRV